MAALAAPPPAREAVRTELAEKSLKHFVRQAWHVIEPATPYQHNWHIDALCDHLEATLKGEIRNLLVTMPPRAMKSLTISVFFPAWAWIHKPELRFVYASYAQALSTEHSQLTRMVIESEWYQQRWGDRYQLAEDDNLKTRFSNTKRGQRIATSVGAAVTGFGGDFVIADDPHNVQQAESDAVRQSAVDWWNRAMSTRLNNPNTGVRIVVMQRVHENDVAGSVLSSGQYTHLNLPMEYDPEATGDASPIGWEDPRTEEGELLWPARYDAEKIAEFKSDLGSYAYASQFQQQPSPKEGGTFKRGWWQRYRTTPDLTRAELFVDSAFKEGVENDYSAIALWGTDSLGNAYVVRVWRERVAFPDLIRLGHDAHAWAKQHYPRLRIPLVVEDKASGQSAIQVWDKPYHTASGVLPALPVITFKIKGTQSKIARAEGVTALVEGGRVFVPESAPWLDDWLDEHQKFPTGKHDDQVDTTSMALTRLDLGPRRGFGVA